MRPDIKVEITVGALQAMTAAQFAALQDIIREGMWETAAGVRVSGGGDYIGVEPLDGHITETGVRVIQGPMMFIGIERDGYTHS